MIDPTAVIRRPSNLYGEISIGPRTKIAAGVDAGDCTIGADCKLQAGSFVAPGTVIGDRVFVGPGATICNDRDPHAVGEWTPQPVTIGDDASIGACAVIHGGVTIGAGAVIDATSNVIRDVPAGGRVRAPQSTYEEPARCVS